MIFDRAAALAGAARSSLVLAFASDEVLARYSDLAYGATTSYLPDSPDFDANLFPFEEAAFDTFFPPPPGRVLVGATGGGREALALARRGYEVVAFEPSAPLIAGLAAHIPAGLKISAYRATYEDLPHMAPALPGEDPADLNALPRFDAAILGWGSLSHLLSEQRQVTALRAMAAVTDGPVLVSFRTDPHATGEARGQLEQLKQLLPGRNKIHGNYFTMQIGFYQAFSRKQLESIFAQAGLKVEKIDAADSSGFWGHAVLTKP
jgi:hypothetical protein